MESLRAKAKEARLATDLYKATSAGNVAQLTEMLVATKAKADGATTRRTDALRSLQTIFQTA